MTHMQWTAFPEGPLECSGLPWLDENIPDLWRLPRQAASSMPDGVQRQVRFSAGARLRLHSDTSELRFRVSCAPECPAPRLDVYVDNRFWCTAAGPKDGKGDVMCFAGANREPKEVTVYLPFRQELQIAAFGVDGKAECGKPQPFTREHPFVLYGSSVAQGVGAARPGMGYASILGRLMNIDHVNLGFGGAGKAEAEVIALVTQIDACCYLLDLGKSYGQQTSEAYAAMLTTLRRAHPDTPIVCITPIFSSREFYNNPYVDLSHHARTVVRESVKARVAHGDELLFLVEGQTLLSSQDCDGLSSDGVHPNDLGHSRIAERLRPALEKALQATENRDRTIAFNGRGKPHR